MGIILGMRLILGSGLLSMITVGAVAQVANTQPLVTPRNLTNVGETDVNTCINNRKLKPLKELGEKILSHDVSVENAELIGKICDALSTYEFSDNVNHSTLAEQNVIADHFAIETLRKISELKVQISIDLNLEILSHLSPVAFSDPYQADLIQLRDEKVEAWLAGWSLLQKKIDPNYQPVLHWKMNAAPPLSSHMPDGVPPEAIKDPHDRKVYEDQIAEINKASEIRLEQAHLRQIDAKFRNVLISFLVNCFAKTPADQNKLSSALKQHDVNEEICSIIFSQLERRRKIEALHAEKK